MRVRDGLCTVGSFGVATTLVFALAESVISFRTYGVRTGSDLGTVIASSCLRLLGCDDLTIDAAAAEYMGLLALAKRPD